VSPNKRYFQHADGTPFFWLGDTWWMGLSDRLPWSGFQQLTADRKAKGFTVVQIVAGLVPFEEVCPIDPGCRNEGGPVWEAGYSRINPNYFDAADRRVQLLVDSGIAPAIVGGWHVELAQMGVAKMKKHWRYIIARYGAYPVFWIVGGEVVDPPAHLVARLGPSYPGLAGGLLGYPAPGAWTEVAHALRATDPYHHPVTAHEGTDPPLQDEAATDFELYQAGHSSWASIGAEVVHLNLHYVQAAVTKPLIIGEIGYETLGQQHFADFQRTAFWLSMLNGAAGHTYGADGVFESYTADKRLHRMRWSFMNWKEGMNLPGSSQVGLNARLLQRYSWWKFQPHPEWIIPRGTTLLEPRASTNGGDLPMEWSPNDEDPSVPTEAQFPGGEWQAKHGTFRLPYAAGVPREVRVIYMPYFGLVPRRPPTVLGLESGVRYHAYLWDPSMGIQFDLGIVERPTPGALLIEETAKTRQASDWTDHRFGSIENPSAGAVANTLFSLRKGITEQDLVATVSAGSQESIGVVLRFQDADDYLVGMYSAQDKGIYLVQHKGGQGGHRWGWTPAPDLGEKIRLTAEVRGSAAIVAVSDGNKTYTSPIVTVQHTASGGAGVVRESSRGFEGFELRKSPRIVQDDALERTLKDAAGQPRGELKGPDISLPGQVGEQSGWDQFAKKKLLLLDAYRPEALPNGQDWVLVLSVDQKR
jgi:hypothetical protein